MGQSGRCEQAVDNRDSSDGRHATPLIGDRVVDAQHAPIECSLNVPQPAFKCRRFARVSRPCKFNAFSDLAKYERAEKNILVCDGRVPGRHMWVAVSALPNLRNNVSVNQIAHRSTSRPGSRLRSRSIPSSGADASRAFRLTLHGSTKRCRRSRRASARREGSDKAEATWRTRLASSLRTLTSTRTRPWRSIRARCFARGDFALPAIIASDISGNITGKHERAQAGHGGDRSMA